MKVACVLLVAVALAAAAAAPAGAAADVPSLYGQSWFATASSARITGPDFPPGEFVTLENTLTETVTMVDTRQQVKTGASYEVYLVDSAGSGSFAGVFHHDTWGDIPMRVAGATIHGASWYRVSDLALVHQEQLMGGDLEVYFAGGWIEIGDFSLLSVQEYDPPYEAFDFPLEVGDTWQQSWTLHLWGEAQIATQPPQVVDEARPQSATSVCEAFEARQGTDCYRVQVELSDGGRQTFWYSPERRRNVEQIVHDAPLGPNTIDEGTTTLTGHWLRADPGLTVTVSPNPADPGATCVASGSAYGATTVTLRFPDAGGGPWSAPAGPAFSAPIAAPAGPDGSPEQGASPDGGSHGLVAESDADTNHDGWPDHRAATLVLAGSGPATPTPTPAPTTTPPIEPAVDLQLDQSVYRAGDEFELRAVLVNPGARLTADFYIVLEACGAYYFYPTWGTAVDSETIILGAGQTVPLDILTFTWPAGAGAGGPVTFYGALARPGTVELIGGYDAVAFSFE